MDAFSALAEPTRRNIIEILAQQGQMTSSDIARRFTATPSAISQHLKVLREARLVTMQKKAQQHLYTVDSATLAQLEQWTKELQSTWDHRFDRLSKVINEKENNNGRQEDCN